MVARRAEFLTGYQNARYAARYKALVARVEAAEKDRAPSMSGLTQAVARYYFKLLAVKDEYEVARLHVEHTERLAAERFESWRGLRFHMAPPLLSGKGGDGRPRKIAFGGWMLPVLKLLRRGKALRGGAFDVFGWTAERRLERALVDQFEADLREIARRLDVVRHGLAVEIATLPQNVRGYGPVKSAAAAATRTSLDGSPSRRARSVAAEPAVRPSAKSPVAPQ